MTTRMVEQDAEMMRLQLLGDPALMRQLQQVRPPSAMSFKNRSSNTMFD